MLGRYSALPVVDGRRQGAARSRARVPGAGRLPPAGRAGPPRADRRRARSSSAGRRSTCCSSRPRDAYGAARGRRAADRRRTRTAPPGMARDPRRGRLHDRRGPGDRGCGRDAARRRSTRGAADGCCRSSGSGRSSRASIRRSRGEPRERSRAKHPARRRPGGEPARARGGARAARADAGARARPGEEALGHLLRDEFALILLDVQMPELDGFETAAYIKQREKTRHIPIIFLTALSARSCTTSSAATRRAPSTTWSSRSTRWCCARRSQVFVDLYEKERALRESERALPHGVRARPDRRSR